MHNSSFCNRKSSFFNRKSSCFNINHQISIEKRHFLAHRGEDHRTGIDSSTTKPARDRTCKFIERMQPTLSPYPPRLARAVTTSTAGRRAGLGCPAWAGAPAGPSPAQPSPAQRSPAQPSPAARWGEAGWDLREPQPSPAQPSGAARWGEAGWDSREPPMGFPSGDVRPPPLLGMWSQSAARPAANAGLPSCERCTVLRGYGCA